eukprot:8675770-Prorocentrum_lima.AAC.1
MTCRRCRPQVWTTSWASCQALWTFGRSMQRPRAQNKLLKDLSNDFVMQVSMMLMESVDPAPHD